MYFWNRFLSMLSAAVQRDEFHRAGAIEGVGGDEVFDAVGLHLHQEVLHAAGFELEDAAGLAAAEHLEDVWVGQVDLLDIDAGFVIQRRGGAGWGPTHWAPGSG